MLVDFHHLASAPIEKVLPGICEQVLARGERLLIVATEPLLGALDRQLWAYAPASFLPHGRSDGPSPEAQPVLLSTEPAAANGATNVALADAVWRDEALAFERIYYLFGASHLEPARASWRALSGCAEIEARYWKQDERGEWVLGP